MVTLYLGEHMDLRPYGFFFRVVVAWISCTGWHQLSPAPRDDPFNKIRGLPRHGIYHRATSPASTPVYELATRHYGWVGGKPRSSNDLAGLLE